MSEILKPSRICMLLLATALILSQFIILGCCQNSDFNSDNINTDLNSLTDTNSLVPGMGKLASASTLDERSIVASGNGAMGLLNNMKTGLTQADDGSIWKSRKASLLSYGSDLMVIKDFSRLSGSDTNGNEYSSESEREITLKDCDYPFALMNEDLTKLSSDGGIENVYSNTNVLLPDTSSPEDLEMFNNAFGKSGNINIKMFNLGSYFNMFDLSDYWGLFFPNDDDPNKSITNNGVTCYWKDH